MPGVYRIEYSPNRRAGCQNAECKKAGIKIQAGELRFGTFVTIMEHQTWRWKHWGCVTPQQIHNLKDSVEGDLERYLDGYEELEAPDKAKIAKALEVGHVADDDWRGDIEMNRPGQKGFRTPASKKKAREEAKAGDAAEDEQASPSPSAQKKKRGRAKKEIVEEEDEPAPKKSKKSKAKKEAEEDDNDEPMPKKSRKSKAETGKGKKVKSEDDFDEKGQTKKGQKKTKSKVKDESDAGIKVELHEAGASLAKGARQAPRKATSHKIKSEDADNQHDALVSTAAENDEEIDNEDVNADEEPNAKRDRKPEARKSSRSTASVSKTSTKSKKDTPHSESKSKSTKTRGRPSRSRAT